MTKQDRMKLDAASPAGLFEGSGAEPIASTSRNFSAIRATALTLTVLTGFSGLVYEVVWEKYLTTLLGSHSEATAAILGIFLGGLSLGYSLFGRVTRMIVASRAAHPKAPSLLFVYGLVEASIGAWALGFPLLFKLISGLSLVIPHGSTGAGFAFDMGLGALLLLVPTILMGGTIPILTQALARDLNDSTRFHSFVYAFNTAGAFVGALASGFVLIPWLGLQWTVLAMGGVNLSTGIVFLLMGRAGISATPDAASQFVTPASASRPRVEGFPLYALVASLCGF